jgi:hypothetical protein
MTRHTLYYRLSLIWFALMVLGCAYLIFGQF